MTFENLEKTARQHEASVQSSLDKIYRSMAPEIDGTEAIAWAIAAVAESNLAVAAAISELSERISNDRE